jgi:hypothetical protein
VRLSTFALLIGVPLSLALPGSADVCDATPGNVVQNCDFSEGTYTDVIPYIGQVPDTDPGVPDFWVADPAPDFVEGYLLTGQNTVMTNPVTGTDYLSLGTWEFGPQATLSQNLTDIPGLTYDISGVTDAGGIEVEINGFDAVPNSAGVLSFVGSGSDELSLFENDGASLDIDYIVVAPGLVSEVAEPRTTFLIPVAMLMSLVWLSRRPRATQR